MWKMFRKSFDVDLENSIEYPSSEVICETILNEKGEVEFISRETPVSFKMGNIIYEVEVRMARGGYMLVCTATE